MINHPQSNLPELPINEGFSLSSLYTKAVGLKVCSTKSHHHCHLSQSIPDINDKKGPTPPLDFSNNMFLVDETLIHTKTTQLMWIIC